jgi:hypothetical protein
VATLPTISGTTGPTTGKGFDGEGEYTVQPDQTVADMAYEVLERQARTRVRQTGERFEVAIHAVLCTKAGRQLWKLSRGPRRHESAAEWQKSLARKRAEERIYALGASAFSRVG